MAIKMRCRGCKTQFEFADDLKGKRIKCKTCGDIFRVEKESAKSDDDRPPVRTTSRRGDDDDEEEARKPKSIRAAFGDMEDDDDRPRGRSRQPYDDDEDTRPIGRSRRAYEEDDDPPRRYRDDDDEPRKKKSPALLVGLLLGGLALLITAGAAILIVMKRGGDDSDDVVADVIKAPAKSCPLEVAEKDAGMLVLPDSGNTFGLLRKGDTFKKVYTFDMYDMSAGRRVGRLDLSDMDEPRSVSLSPDGKHLLVMEGAAFGHSDPTISLWSVADNKPIARKWNPYPSKGGLNSPNLYRAEFVGNDKVVTISTSRFVDVWPIPTFDPPVVAGLRIGAVAKADLLGRDDRGGQNKNDKYQRQAAISADRKLLAIWNGDGFTIVNTEGQELGATASAKALVKEFWTTVRFPDRIKGGPVAFSPDGKVLAAIVTDDFPTKRHQLLLWEVKEPLKPPVNFPVYANQLNDSPSFYWWGSKYIVTHGGSQVEGMLIDVRTGLAKRQLMGPQYKHYGFGRDGRLWYAASEHYKEPGHMHVLEGLDPEQLTEPDDYEQIRQLGEEFFLRRLWLEPEGVLRQPTRHDPPLQQRLIRRP